MEPTLCDGDLLLVTRSPRSPRRGRIAVIQMPPDNAPRWQVKRLVGMPGERIAFKDGLLFINETRHTEPYLGGLPANPSLSETAFDIGDNRYFVMGDNRAHSADSRTLGPICADSIVGLVTARLWPPFR